MPTLVFSAPDADDTAVGPAHWWYSFDLTEDEAAELQTRLDAYVDTSYEDDDS